MPDCECGRTFKTDGGLEWHRERTCSLSPDSDPEEAEPLDEPSPARVGDAYAGDAYAGDARTRARSTGTPPKKAKWTWWGGWLFS